MIGSLKQDDVLHPYQERRRQFLIESAETTLSEYDENSIADLLHFAMFGCFAEGLRAVIVGLPNIGVRFFEQAWRTLEIVFSEGPRSSVTMRRESCDDEEFSYYWALAHATRYKTALFLYGNDVEDDVPQGINRMEALLRNTKYLSGRIEGQRVTSLWLYFWLGMSAGQCQRILAGARSLWEDKFTPSTRIKGFKREGSFLRLMALIVQAKTINPRLLDVARESLVGLLQLYRDLEHAQENLGYWSGPLYGFEWSWLWEHLFEEKPDLERAILRLRVTLPLKIVRE